jgi:phosphonate transport system ATP-binding protein
MISISGLSKNYNQEVQALKTVNLNIKSGEFVVLLGQSGAGKSTLLRCINRLVEPSEGEVSFNGVLLNNTKNIKHLRQKTGMIFQHYNLVKRLTVLQNVLCGRLAFNNTLSTCLKFFPQKDVELALACIERVGLSDKTYVRTDQLSGGQQQRVGIARALVQQPQIVLADEPVASLDPYSAEMVMEILQEINNKDGITMVVSLHNVQLARKYAHRVIGIREGRILFDKPVDRIQEIDIDLTYGGTQDTCEH